MSAHFEDKCVVSLKEIPPPDGTLHVYNERREIIVQGVVKDFPLYALMDAGWTVVIASNELTIGST